MATKKSTAAQLEKITLVSIKVNKVYLASGLSAREAVVSLITLLANLAAVEGIDIKLIAKDLVAKHPEVLALHQKSKAEQSKATRKTKRGAS